MFSHLATRERKRVSERGSGLPSSRHYRSAGCQLKMTEPIHLHKLCVTLVHIHAFKNFAFASALRHIGSFTLKKKKNYEYF